MTRLPQFIHGVIFITFLNAHLIEKLEDTPPSNSERTHNIAIIGAGLSGLTATLTLVKNIDATNGLDYKIRVLEATDRIGGRVKTVTHDSKKFETGATFVNTEHTKIRELAAELNQTLFNKPAESFEQVIYLKNRSPEFGAEFNEEILTCVHDRQISQYETVWENYDYESSITVTDMLQKCNATDYYKTLSEVAMRTEMGIDASECPAWLLEESWNIDLEDKIFQVFGNVGDEASYYQDGAESFVWKLLTRISEISAEKSIEVEFLTGHKIHEVAESANGVKLSGEKPVLRDESTDFEQVFDHVIMTASLGAYKNMLKIRHESITAEQVEFLEEFPMGSNAKMFLVFSEKWWDGSKNMDFIADDYIVWLNHDDEIYEDRNDGTHSLTVYVGGSKVGEVASGALNATQVLKGLSEAYPGRNVTASFLTSYSV